MDFSPVQIAIVLLVILLVFGPKRLPEFGRSLGRGIREFKSSVTGSGKDDQPQIEATEDDEGPVEGEVVSDHKA